MKFISTVAFLLLSFASLFISTKVNKLILESFKASTHRTTRISLLRYASFFIVFVQFWVLARIFPIYLILLLIGASTLGLIINTLMGAISGFTLEENKQKIGALSLIWGASQGQTLGCVMLVLGPIVTLSSAIFSLWYFWKYPIGDPRARVMIALFHFALPQLFRIPVLLLMTWPSVTSEYLDDDLRNSHLAEAFSNIIYQTIFLLFPFWLFKQEINAFQWRLPPFWILLSIPLIVFIVGGLLPFFVGLYRYRSQARSMTRWQANWLKDMLVTNELPAGQARDSSFNQQFEELNNEIQVRISQNELLGYYRKLWEGDSSTSQLTAVESLPAAVAVDNLAPQPEQIGAGEPASTALVPRAQANPIAMVKMYLKPGPAANTQSTDLTDQVVSIIKANQGNLVHWDIRFAHLQDLFQLYDATVEAKTKDISGFVKARLAAVNETLSARTQRKNILAGALLSCSSTAIIFLFKHYEPVLNQLIDRLVR